MVSFVGGAALIVCQFSGTYFDCHNPYTEYVNVDEAAYSVLGVASQKSVYCGASVFRCSKTANAPAFIKSMKATSRIKHDEHAHYSE